MLVKTMKPLLACVGVAALLVGCGADDRVAEAPEENEIGSTAYDTYDPADTDMDRQAGDETYGVTEDETGDTMAQNGLGLDGLNPVYLRDRVISNENGEMLGNISEVVVDDAGELFAVIDLDSPWEREDRDLAVAPLEDIRRERNEVLLMSQADDLEAYEPEKFNTYTAPSDQMDTEPGELSDTPDTEGEINN